MAEHAKAALFLDTSIQIARMLHSSEMKKRIQERIDVYDRTATGLVVRQEFRRRVLKEAEYLLRLLHRYKSYDEVYHHVVRLPNSWRKMERKRNICLQTLGQVMGGADTEKTDRLRLYLRSLLVNGMKTFDQSVDTIRQVSGCGCGKRDVIEREKLRKYDLGEERCSRTRPGECGIVAFLASRKDWSQRILQKLRSLSAEQKSSELSNAERFLERLFDRPNQANQDDPCLSVGDLLIALESVDEPNFFTVNSKESQHLCRALGQTLVVRPIDPTKPDVVCASQDPQWPAFGHGGKEG